MIKNKLDYKLVNTMLIVLIIYLMYQAGGLWQILFNKALSVLIPFFLSFIIAYALYPYTVKLKEKGVPKSLSLFIVLIIFFGLFALMFLFAIPLLLKQLTGLFSSLIAFVREISIKFDLDFGPLQDMLNSTLNDIIKNSGKIISSGAITFIGTSISYISTTIIIIFLSIYLLVDMEKIRNTLKNFFKKGKSKTYGYVKELDNAMKGYLTGFTRIMIITLFEYMFAFLIIGHPQAILLGFLAAIGNLIPYFGGIITNVISMITALSFSPALFIRALILFIVLSLVDSYIINPFVYGKTTKVPGVVIIISVFAGGILFGIMGIIISLPVAVAIITTINYYKDDISDKIEEIKS